MIPEPHSAPDGPPRSIHGKPQISQDGQPGCRHSGSRVFLPSSGSPGCRPEPCPDPVPPPPRTRLRLTAPPPGMADLEARGPGPGHRTAAHRRTSQIFLSPCRAEISSRDRMPFFSGSSLTRSLRCLRRRTIRRASPASRRAEDGEDPSGFSALPKMAHPKAFHFTGLSASAVPEHSPAGGFHSDFQPGDTADRIHGSCLLPVQTE